MADRSSFDVIVVGAGHAGCEAALAAGRIGARTALVTGNLDTIAKMSCNPAIGGLAKGQLAREVDALGGMMGLATDANGIHFRLLGTSKGPAMWSPRAQCDKPAYSIWAKDYVERAPNVLPVAGEVGGLSWHDENGVPTIDGVKLRDGRTLKSTKVIVTTGTFLRSLMHMGDSKTAGGRMGDHSAEGISGDLQRLGLTLHRLKTGTPMRVHADSIDFNHCEPQAGDEHPYAFSYLNSAPLRGNRIHCYTARTTPAAHAAIHANLDRAPMYNGQINSEGPKYCPSIEDKVVRFSEKGEHPLFLEPEGESTKEVYVNGLSTSLPIEVQNQVLNAIPALQNAHVMRYGYAVEYDSILTDQLNHQLAVPSVPGLYLAGQICGTSGYEEAAIQGLLAGANAALSLAGQDPLIPSRSDGYCGVLIDDLVTRVPTEPYRMFTSRAEHRLYLRSDNADRRLALLAARTGLISSDRAASVQAKADAVAAVLAKLDKATRGRIAGEGLNLQQTKEIAPALNDLPEKSWQEAAWIDLRYAHYLERQQARIERLHNMRDLQLPPDLAYENMRSLSNEARRVLAAKRPSTLGAASTLAGVNPADIDNLQAILQARNG
jgi:tRNA uridine 5-carboxymethylaminomethyl modification enzyme